MSDDASIAQSVQEYGWHALAVEGEGDNPSFIYTIGLAHTFGHPELVVLGLGPRVGHRLLADMVDDIKGGRAYEAGQRYGGVLAGVDVAVRSVHPTQHAILLGYAMGFYRLYSRPELLSARQVFWPDKAGLFPFELKCDPLVAATQRRLELAVPPFELKAFMEKYGY
jgi:hypothetical protein